jgi:hypothetical protein
MYYSKTQATSFGPSLVFKLYFIQILFSCVGGNPPGPGTDESAFPTDRTPTTGDHITPAEHKHINLLPLTVRYRYPGTVYGISMYRIHFIINECF